MWELELEASELAREMLRVRGSSSSSPRRRWQGRGRATAAWIKVQAPGGRVNKNHLMSDSKLWERGWEKAFASAKGPCSPKERPLSELRKGNHGELQPHEQHSSEGRGRGKGR